MLGFHYDIRAASVLLSAPDELDHFPEEREISASARWLILFLPPRIVHLYFLKFFQYSETVLQ